MSKSYNLGQGVLVGESATTGDITLNQQWKAAEIDLAALANELRTLRRKMKDEGTAPAHDIAIGHVALSETAAINGDSSGAMAALKQAGKWTLDLAEKIGVPVATAALKAALGA